MGLFPKNERNCTRQPPLRNTYTVGWRFGGLMSLPQTRRVEWYSRLWELRCWAASIYTYFHWPRSVSLCYFFPYNTHVYFLPVRFILTTYNVFCHFLLYHISCFFSLQYICTYLHTHSCCALYSNLFSYLQCIFVFIFLLYHISHFHSITHMHILTYTLFSWHFCVPILLLFYVIF